MFRYVASLAVAAVVALSWFFFGNHDQMPTPQPDTTTLQQSAPFPADDMAPPKKRSFDTR